MNSIIEVLTGEWISVSKIPGGLQFNLGWGTIIIIIFVIYVIIGKLFKPSSKKA